MKKKYKPSLSHMKAILYKPLIFFFLFIGIAFFCDYQTKGFRFYEICSDIENRPSWEISETPPSDKISPLFSQVFTFYSKGDQSYVFLGEDQETILKFFKHDHLSPIKLLKKIFPFSHFHVLLTKVFQSKDRYLIPVFDSAKIAFDHLKEETGLLYVHLNKTHGICPIIEIKDNLGISHTVALDETEFVIQKRAKLAFPKIKRLLVQKDFISAKQHIRELMRALSSRCEKGIRNVDYSSHRNMGILHHHIIEFDIGSYVYDVSVTEETGKKIELLNHTKKIRRWLKKYSPDLITFYESQIHYWTTSAPRQPVFIPIPETAQAPL
jgi:hypothetical protein